MPTGPTPDGPRPNGSQEVLVCGGGIGGAVLAELLARAGRRVLVLERSLEPPTFLRPEVLWPASIERLCGLHPRELWESEAALAVRGLRVQEGRRELARIGERHLIEAGVQPWFVNPNAARELLLRRASFELRRGVEVLSVVHEGGRIAGVRVRDRASGAESELRAALTVGDDGERSIVRAGCGIEMETETFPLDFVCFAIDWPRAFERAVGRVWINPRGRETGIVAFGAMPFPGGRGAAVVPVRSPPAGGAAPLGDAKPGHAPPGDAPLPAGAWRDFLEVDPDLAALAGSVPPSSMVRVRRSFGHAPRYGAPGAVLIGDAAHPVSPAGGQGANMSIADAHVLAGRLAGAGPDLVRSEARVLADYEQLRREANARSVRISRNAARALSLPESLAGPAFRLARLFLGRSSVLKRLLRSAATSFVGGG